MQENKYRITIQRQIGNHKMKPSFESWIAETKEHATKRVRAYYRNLYSEEITILDICEE
jgi:Zn/Cd-binding protein ZinT